MAHRILYRWHAVALLVIAAAAVPALPAFALDLASVGTAFEVSDGGHLVTNFHVIAECKAVQIRLGEIADDAIVVATDPAHDLALLLDSKRLFDRINYRRLTGSVLPYARFRGAREFLVLGEPLTVVGFPLQGIVGGINVTTGIVSATSGPGGNADLFQITAPTQPGNSGGPAFDEHGAVIGVTSLQINEIELARQRGISAQNVNFAIQVPLVREFVRRFVAGATDDGAAPAGPVDTVTIASRARQYIFAVHCLK